MDWRYQRAVKLLPVRLLSRSAEKHLVVPVTPKEQLSTVTPCSLDIVKYSSRPDNLTDKIPLEICSWSGICEDTILSIRIKLLIPKTKTTRIIKFLCIEYFNLYGLARIIDSILVLLGVKPVSENIYIFQLVFLNILLSD